MNESMKQSAFHQTMSFPFEIGDLGDYDYQDAQYRVRIDLATDQMSCSNKFQWPIIDEVEQTIEDEQQPVESTRQSSKSMAYGAVC